MITKFYNKLNIDAFGFWFILFGLITQIITYIFTEDTLLSIISGSAGVISVVLCSQRRVSFYLWGFLQLGTFMIICIQENLYGKIIENTFYTITMLYGLQMWKNHTDEDETVETKSLTYKQNILLMLFVLASICILYNVLTAVNGSFAFFDSISTTLAITAQILMITRYKESWAYWFFVDIFCVILFVQAENWCMVMQYIFWTLNCIYGFIKWQK